MNAAISVDASQPFAAQAAVAEAISGYRTRLDMSIAHANCLGMLAYTKDPDTQVFLQSCLIALRRKLSFGAFSGPSISPFSSLGGDPARGLSPRAGGPDSP